MCLLCCRVRIGKAPAEREVNPNRKSALEMSMRNYIAKRDGNVVNPSIGTSFDSLDEAYQFYNLFSWEVGFGIKYAKSRLNVHRAKCMQEIVCGCAVSCVLLMFIPLGLFNTPRSRLSSEKTWIDGVFQLTVFHLPTWRDVSDA